jgi:hypothetical protein
MTLQMKPCGSSFVNNLGNFPYGDELTNHLFNGRWGTVDGTEVTNFPILSRIGESDVDRFFVDIKTDKRNNLIHDLPPRLLMGKNQKWYWRPID